MAHDVVYSLAVVNTATNLLVFLYRNDSQTALSWFSHAANYGKGERGSGVRFLVRV
jgi:hypothetical protein